MSKLATITWFAWTEWDVYALRYPGRRVSASRWAAEPLARAYADELALHYPGVEAHEVVVRHAGQTLANGFVVRPRAVTPAGREEIAAFYDLTRPETQAALALARETAALDASLWRERAA